jgi:uncharacterized spore protein YtfJ
MVAGGMYMVGQGSRPRALRVKVVRGDPYYVDGRELIPVVRVVSFGKATATIGTRQVGGRGGGFVWVKPLAVLEVTPTGERRIAIQRGTAAAARGMLAAAISIALVFTAIRWVVYWKRKKSRTR